MTHTESGINIRHDFYQTGGFEHGCTQWTIASDIVNKKMFFRTALNPKISFIDLNKLDFSQGQPVRYLDFTQKDLSGDVISKIK